MDNDVKIILAQCKKEKIPAFLTGSRSAGLETRKSDWDIVVYQDVQKIQNMFPEFTTIHKSYGNLNEATVLEYKTYKWKFFVSKKINIMICDLKPTFDSWFMSTLELKLNPSKYKIKKQRGKLFNIPYLEKRQHFNDSINIFYNHYCNRRPILGKSGSSSDIGQTI